jgi:hypothetical protein
MNRKDSQWRDILATEQKKWEELIKNSEQSGKDRLKRQERELLARAGSHEVDYERLHTVIEKLQKDNNRLTLKLQSQTRSIQTLGSLTLGSNMPPPRLEVIKELVAEVIDEAEEDEDNFDEETADQEEEKTASGDIRISTNTNTETFTGKSPAPAASAAVARLAAPPQRRLSLLSTRSEDAASVRYIEALRLQTEEQALQLQVADQRIESIQRANQSHTDHIDFLSK